MPPTYRGLLVCFVHGSIYWSHGLPTLLVQRQQQISDQTNQFIFIYFVYLEEVSHAAPMLPALLPYPAVSLDDDGDHLLLAGVDVDHLDLAVFETEDEISSSTNIPE